MNMCYKSECSNCLVAYKILHFYFVLIFNIFIDFVHVFPLNTVLFVAAAT